MINARELLHRIKEKGFSSQYAFDSLKECIGLNRRSRGCADFHVGDG